MTELIAYLRKNNNIALFCSEGQFWIGNYDPSLNHTSNEPPYVLIRGYFDTVEDAQTAVQEFMCEEI